MLNYVVTVAISAFFVPHYLGSVFWEALRHSPGDIIAGAIIIAVLSAINIVGVKESAGLNIVLAVVDFLTQVLLVIVGAVLVLGADPGRWSTTSRSAWRPRGRTSSSRSRSA